MFIYKFTVLPKDAQSVCLMDVPNPLLGKIAVDEILICRLGKSYVQQMGVYSSPNRLPTGFRVDRSQRMMAWSIWLNFVGTVVMTSPLCPIGTHCSIQDIRTRRLIGPVGCWLAIHQSCPLRNYVKSKAGSRSKFSAIYLHRSYRILQRTAFSTLRLVTHTWTRNFQLPASLPARLSRSTPGVTLPADLEQYDTRGNGDVEAGYRSRHGNPDDTVAGFQGQTPKTFALGPEHQGERA